MITRKIKLFCMLGLALVLAGMIVGLSISVPQLAAQSQLPQPGSDAAIYALIDTLREKAAQIQIDGKGEDWEGIPTFTDPAGDAENGDPSWDIVKTAVAPLEDELLVLITTSGKPAQTRYAFWFFVDYLGSGRNYEFQIGLDVQGKHTLHIYEENQPLDPPLPHQGTPPLAIELPFNSDNKWFIGQGSFTTSSHAGLWAYDFWMVDDLLCPSHNDRNECWSKRNEDYYSWEKPLLTPIAGRVIAMRSDAPDNPIAGQPSNAGGNHVDLDIGNNVVLGFGHFRQGSVTVALGEEVPAGKVLGLMGNSGFSGLPHLHLGFERLPPPTRETLPLAFANVRVSINPQPNDPWTRELVYWEPREHFFVERMQPVAIK